MTMRAQLAAWMQPVLQWRDGLPASGACAVVFPGYRPDLVQVLAKAMDVHFIDFRQAIMAPLGWQAANLTPDALTATARQEMGHGRDVMLHNAEALLSLLSREQREEWFASAATQTWARRLIIPLTLFAHDLPVEMLDRVFELDAAKLPPEGILQRLASIA
jgi:hypothetical protein